MTPKQLWDWVDALESIKSNEEYEGFFSDWAAALVDEITQGRALIVNASFDRGLVLSDENNPVRVQGCTFRNIVSAYPLKLG